MRDFLGRFQEGADAEGWGALSRVLLTSNPFLFVD